MSNGKDLIKELQSILELIDEFQLDLKTKLAITDYELQIGNSIQQVFGQIEPTGCYFHFKQAIMRKVGELNLRPTYGAYIQFPDRLMLRIYRLEHRDSDQNHNDWLFGFPAS